MSDVEPRAEETVTVQFLGGLQVWIGDKEIAARKLPRLGLLLARLAFPRLWDARGNLLSAAVRRTATRNELIQAIWPEDELETGPARLRQLMSDLRRLLQPAAPASGQVLVTDGERVSLGVALVTDLDPIPPALYGVRQLGDPAERALALLAALRLFRGKLLEGYEAPWLDRERTALADLYAQAFEDLASLLNEPEAASLVPDALAVMQEGWNYLRDPWLLPARCEACATALMRLCLRAARPQDALAHFARLESVLKHGGRAPSAEALALRRQAQEDAREQRPARIRRPLIGRDGEVQRLERVLRTHPPLVTVTGPPGVGKTRLAEELAWRLRPEWGGAAHFVALQHVAAAQDIPQAILREIGEPYRDGEALEQAVASLSRAPCLLVLDNCEHLLTEQENGAEMIHALLTRAPTLTCLTTSRSTLRLEAETEFRLGPLPVPTGTEPLEAICGFPSVQMFVQQAQAMSPGFQINESNAAAVAHLCALLDGLPLAITLAAGWVQVRAPGLILKDIAALRTRPSPLSRRTRHPTLYAAIQGSYALLPPDQAGAFRSLAVFQGGWTLEAAEAVCTGRDGGADIPLLLSQLADRSLIEAEASGTTEPRMRLLAAIREFAQGKLATSGEERQAGSAHARYCLSLAEALSRDLVGPQQAAALARLRREADNLLAALAWCFAPEGDAETGIRLALALYPYWEAGGQLHEARHWYAAALEGLGPDGDLFLRARAHTCSGVLANKQGEYGTARGHHAQSLRLYRRVGNARAMGVAMLNLGLTAKYQGRYAKAASLYRRSLQVHRALGERLNEALALTNLASVVQEQGDYETAARYLEESLSILREQGSPAAIGRAINNLGNVRVHQGQMESARILFSEGLRLQREIGNRPSVAVSLLNLAELSASLKDHDAARAYLAECLPLSVEVGDTDTTSCALTVCAEIARAQEQWPQAATLCGVVVALREKIGFPFPPDAQASWERTCDGVRAALGPEVFDAYAAVGKSWRQEETVKSALAF